MLMLIGQAHIDPQVEIYFECIEVLLAGPVKHIGFRNCTATSRSILNPSESWKTIRAQLHIDIRYHYVREALERVIIDIEYCPTEFMAADLLTYKPLRKSRFETHRCILGMNNL